MREQLSSEVQLEFESAAAAATADARRSAATTRMGGIGRLLHQPRLRRCFASSARYVTHTTANPVESWEIDALDPNHLRERVASRIAQFIEPDAWAQSLRIQTAEVDSMRRFQRAWKGVQK